MKAGIEYNEYYERYIKLGNPKPLQEALAIGMQETVAFFRSIPETLHEYRYEEGKWTPKEVLLHIIDTERVFAYRALQFSRADNVVLEGYDQDVFAKNARPVTHSMQSLIDEYVAVRQASIRFVANSSADSLLRAGVASSYPLSVRAAFRIISGHEVHHSEIIKERYLS